MLIRNPQDVRRFREQHRDESSPWITVALWISSQGSVEGSEIIQSSGREDLDRLALQLFNEVARFRPAQLGGVLMSMSAILSVTFSGF